MTVLLFFIVLFVLILVHEWGHFIVAKKTGMRVDEFGIGFPPKLFGKKWRGTEYTFNMLPIGGFVRIFGENAQDAAEVASDGGDVSGSFTSKSKWAQAAVLIAGVMMNILFAWFLFVVVLMMGVPSAVSPEEATEDAALTVTQVVVDTPASEAMLPVGAEVVSVTAGDTQLDTLTPKAFAEFTGTKNTEVAVTYVKNDEQATVTITPEQNIIPDDPNRYALGVALALIEEVRQPIHLACYEAVKMTRNMLVGITVGIATLLGQSVQGTADFSQVAGPIGIVGLVGDAAEFGLASLLMFTAIISLNLAVINMFPFPALDGGRLVFVAIEAIIRRPISPVWTARLNLAGFALLMLLMVVVTWNDIARLL